MWPYLVPAALLFAETGLLVGVFIPGGDTMIIGLGLLAADGELRLVPLLATLFAGSVLGHNLGYWWGLRLGPALFKRVPTHYLERTQRLYGRWGSFLIVAAPLIPYVRTLVPFMMGALRVPWPRFFLLSLLGSVVWTQVLALLGYFLGGLLPKWLVFVVAFGLIALGFLPKLVQAGREYLGARVKKRGGPSP